MYQKLVITVNKLADLLLELLITKKIIIIIDHIISKLSNYFKWSKRQKKGREYEDQEVMTDKNHWVYSIVFNT